MAGVRGGRWATDPWAEEAQLPVRPLRQVLAAPPGWPFHLLVTAVAVLLVSSTGTPGWATLPFLGFAFLLLLLGVVWFVRLCLYVGIRPADPPHSSWRGFLVAPVLVVVAGGLIALDVPVRVGFAISRAEMQAVADRVLDARMPEGGPSDGLDADLDHVDVQGRYGLYTITHVRGFPNGVVLFESNGAFFDDAGFAYFPDGNLPDGDGSFESPDFRALGGGWYAFTSSW